MERATSFASNYKPSPFKKMTLFTSNDCIYCKQASKISRKVAKQLGNRLIEYNINDFPQLVDDKKISIVPTLIIGEEQTNEEKLTGSNFSEGEILKLVFNASCT